MIKFSMNGFTGALDSLKVAISEPTLRATGYAGAKVFQDQAIRNVPVKTGTIRDNIIVKRAEEKSDGANRQTYLVTVRKGKYNAEGDAFYWRFVEDGHSVVRRKPKGAPWKAHREAQQREFGTSKVPARPFMRPAFFSMRDTATKAMMAKLKEKISENVGGKK